MEDSKGINQASSENNEERRGDGKAVSPPPHKSWFDVIDKISEYTGKSLSWFIVVIVVIYCTEVFLRSVFNAPTIWAHESSTYFFGAFFMLGGAYALRMGKMVNVDIFVNRFSPRTRALVDGLMNLIALAFLFVLIYKGTELAYSSIMKNETSQTPWAPPIYPLKITAVVGALLVFLQELSQTIRSFIFAFKGGAKP